LGWWTSQISPRPPPAQRAGASPERCRTPSDNEGQGCCVWHWGRESAPTTHAREEKRWHNNITYSIRKWLGIVCEVANFHICSVCCWKWTCTIVPCGFQGWTGLTPVSPAFLHCCSCGEEGREGGRERERERNHLVQVGI
jgi:hypothetical protein